MRFIGNKTNLLNDIQKVIKENCDGSEKVFCDLFSGTSSVARFFKNEYKIISNDMLYFSYVLQKATIQNNQIPDFKKVKIAGLSIEWENGADICPDELYNNSYIEQAT